VDEVPGGLFGTDCDAWPWFCSLVVLASLAFMSSSTCWSNGHRVRAFVRSPAKLRENLAQLGITAVDPPPKW
jgi:hypothetical protein